MKDVRPELGFGQWYGKRCASRFVSSFCVSEMEPEAWGDALPEHSHSEAHIVLSINGKYVSSASGAPPVCNSSVVIYNPPGVVHRDRFESSAGRFLAISMAADRFASTGGVLPGDAFAVSSAPVLVTAHKLLREQRAYEATSELILEGICIELFGLFGRFTKNSKKDRPAWLSTVQELLQDNLERELTFDDLTKAVGISAHELSTNFQRHFHCSPGHFVKAKRMARARDLLATRAPLVQIAAETGFSDQSAFSKAFRKTHGVPPGVYRRILLNG